MEKKLNQNNNKNTLLTMNVITHLTRHNFTVDSTDINASIKASLVVGVHDVPTKGLVSTYTTVVRTLHGYKTWFRNK